MSYILRIGCLKIICTKNYVDLFVVTDSHPGIRFDKVRILQQRGGLNLLWMSVLNFNCDYL